MELIKLHTSDDDSYIGYAESRIGGRVENQDSFSCADTAIGFLVTVCDGMGGGPGGKTASNIAVTKIIDEVKKSGDVDKTPIEIIKNAIEQANHSVFAAAVDNPQLKGMGTTVVVLLLNDQAAIVAHVGDSRIYQLRGKQKIFRTSDHSLVFDLVKQGIITEEQARLSAQSNIITNALGVKENVDVEICEIPYERGDRFMLSSDGVHGSMSEKELLNLATDSKNALGPIVDNIATTADDLGRMNGGGHDNLTVVLIQTKTNSKIKSKMPKRAKIIILFLTVLCILSFVFNIIQCTSKKSDNTNLSLNDKKENTVGIQSTDSVTISKGSTQ